MDIIKIRVTKYLLIASFFTLFTLFILFNSNMVIANAESILPKGYIDTPANGSIVTGEIPVNGWFLDANGVSKLEILVDGKSMGEAQYSVSRPDVFKAFPEYQNANSGYQFTLNVKNLTNGNHKLTVRETGLNGAVNELDSTVINVQNLQAKGYMDTPANGSVLKGEIHVNGWFLDGSGVSKIEILVDGKKVGEAQYGNYRYDVGKAFPEYKNANAGYQFTLNARSLANGQHRLTVREIGNNGNTTELESLLVNVQNEPVRGSIDTPSNGSVVKGEIPVNGWFLDANGVSKVEVMVDGKSMGEAQYGISRPDVFKAYPDYKNENAGYQFTLNTGSLTNGQHRLTVREIGNNGITNELESQLITVQNEPVRGSIDTPSNGAAVKGEIPVNGWFLDISGVSKIEILVDGNIMGEAQYGISRPDVFKAYPQYKNSNAGYQFSLNTKSLTNGQHSLTVRETGKNGMTKELDRLTVDVQNIPTVGYIDSPLSGIQSNGEITVSGWYLDVSGVSKIEVFVDGMYVGQAQYGLSRPDVQQVFPEFGNGNSGYRFTLNTAQYSQGEHTVTVKETGNNGSTSSLTTSFFNGNPYLYVDLRKPSNITANDIINFFNVKRPDSPLKNYAQSFIDAQSKYGVNAQYLVAHAIWETGWDGSNLRNFKFNLYGYGAYDPCPFTCGYYFPTGGDSINFVSYTVRKDYLTESGAYYNGANLVGMNVRYATDQNWKNGIANLMQSIKPFDAGYYNQRGPLPVSPVIAPSFGRNIPAGQPYPTDVIINYPAGKTATVTTNGLSFRSIPYTLQSTFISSLSFGTNIEVLGYNTDVRYVPGDISKYPYDQRWYRVKVNGQEGWVYGGGITFNN
ncbi:Ig-like domain-containing protein [Bacillus sp. OK048]|uniref:Ig-like domain-containing protein n=1 Tax=Bacillus sp. OK048 TaxID=1882761 RepID=UPI00088086C1|nr:Ig-like domain-containing protein [Bacillus sp. OK048]SDM69732.1 Beta-N-acetylglucosaminidase [Bacillus sp. OK048]